MSRLPAFFHKIEVNIWTDALAFIIPEKQQPNLTQMWQSWSKGNINGEIELYASRSLQNPGFMALALIGLES